MYTQVVVGSIVCLEKKKKKKNFPRASSCHASASFFLWDTHKERVVELESSSSAFINHWRERERAASFIFRTAERSFVIHSVLRRLLFKIIIQNRISPLSILMKVLIYIPSSDETVLRK